MHVALAEFQRQLDDAREKLTAGVETDMRSAARSFYERELARDDDERASKIDRQSQAEIERFYALKLRQLVAGRLDDEEAEALIGWAADELISRGEASADARPDLLRTLAGIKLEALQRAEERDQGKIGLGEPKHPALVDAPQPVAHLNEKARSRVVSDDSLKPLSAMLGRFHEERKVAQATKDEHCVAVRMLEEFLGERAVCEITKRDMLAFKTALNRAPNRYTLRFPGMTLPEAIEANAKRREPFLTLTATTINKKWLAHVKALFAWCIANDVLPDNPADGVKVDEGKGMREPTRIPFTPDDLQRLFGIHFAPDGEFGTYQWALLIALFTGARSSSEIARIKLSEIRVENGVQVFELTEASKNSRSKRIVPIHKQLLTLGLAEYVDRLKRRGETRLFPDWQPEDKVNRWFLRTYRRAVGIHDQRKVFHSFRHTLKTALARAGVNRDVSDLITGHADQSVAAIYIHDKHVTMIQVMSEALDRLTFDTVDWHKLKNMRAATSKISR